MQCAVNDGYKNQTAINQVKMHERSHEKSYWTHKFLNLCESLIQLKDQAGNSDGSSSIVVDASLKKINKLLNTKIHSSIAINYF